MENQSYNAQNDETPGAGITIPVAPQEIITPDEGRSATGTPPQVSNFDGLRKYLAGALTAAAVLTSANQANADEPKKEKPEKEKVVQIARVKGEATDSGGVVVKPADKVVEKPQENHLKHHAIKIGAIGSIDRHPSFGTEVTWSYMPNLDESSKLHFTVTPIDFFAAQHHLHYEGKGEANGGIKTEPKYFIGSLAGFTYLFNKHLELEFEIGGGAMMVPYYKNFENGKFEGLKYQPAPVLKADVQMDFIVNPHFRTYIAYSPEYVPMPIPHAMKDNKIEKEPHLSHILAVGVGTEF